MTQRTRFVGVKLSAAETQQLILVSLELGEPGNFSAAVRWLVDQSQGLVQQRLGEGERYEVLSSLAQRMMESKLAKSKSEVLSNG